MAPARCVIACGGVWVCVSGESAIATRLDLRSDIVVPSSTFVPSLAATLRITQIEARVFWHAPIGSTAIPRRIQILDSGCFHSCESLSSISFELDS
jgi:hypothetical protein